MNLIAGRGPLLRMFGSALIGQVLLSATSFGVGLLLIRYGTDRQYGYYVLMTGAIILAVSLQNAFIAPAMISRMTTLGRTGCGELTGGLYREQRRIIVGLGGVGLLAILLLWQSDLIDGEAVALLIAALVALLVALQREYFRMVLLAYRRAYTVLRGDVLYATLLIAGIVLATRAPSGLVAAAAAVAVAVAAIVAARWLSAALRRDEAWDPRGVPGILRQIAPLATWSTAGAAIHWSFSQGYGVLAATTLDISAVAAIAATRMLAMPVTLLSTGIGSLMLPLTARWLADLGATRVLWRLSGMALAIALASLVYFTVLWLCREWVFEVILNKRFAQGDGLLLLWSASFVMMAVHQQLLWMLIARARFHTLTVLALISASIALTTSYIGLRELGVIGAPLGILVGETVNVIGILLLCLRERGLDPTAPTDTQDAPSITPSARPDLPALSKVNS